MGQGVEDAGLGLGKTIAGRTDKGSGATASGGLAAIGPTSANTGTDLNAPASHQV